MFAAQPDETLPPRTEASARERMRWEKELLGLYLSGHPMGDLIAEVNTYVNAYSGDMGEELDQQRVVVGGVVTGIRRVLTKARQTMAVATLEDLQGSLDVVVFPKVFEETGPTWVEDAILLVAGRVDHKGDETVLLADSVWTWEQATILGPVAFGQAVAQGDRGRRGPRHDRTNANGNGNGSSYGRAVPQAVAIPIVTDVADPEAPAAATARPTGRAAIVRVIPRVSPLRGGTVDGTIEVVIGETRPVAREVAAPSPVDAAEPAEPWSEPDSIRALAPDGSDEAPWPEEAQAKLAAQDAAATTPIAAGIGQILHVRFRSAPQDAMLHGFRELRDLIAERPGETTVVLRIPAAGGREQEMELRTGVAYDAELIATIQHRLGQGMVEISLD